MTSTQVHYCHIPAGDIVIGAFYRSRGSPYKPALQICAAYFKYALLTCHHTLAFSAQSGCEYISPKAKVVADKEVMSSS